jgi:hypothetical protein
MTTMRIKNTSKAAQGVHCVGGLEMLDPGEERPLDVLPEYVDRVRGLSFFDVDGAGKAGKDADMLAQLGEKDRRIAELESRVDGDNESTLTKERDDARAMLVDIAALFNDPEVNPGNVKDRVADLIAQVDGGDDAKKPTLAEAVASLDDANADHWIDSGKPKLEVLKELTGADVTRAEVDALKRVRKTA